MMTCLVAEFEAEINTVNPKIVTLKIESGTQGRTRLGRLARKPGGTYIRVNLVSGPNGIAQKEEIVTDVEAQALGTLVT
jgi:hypothetical protein